VGKSKGYGDYCPLEILFKHQRLLDEDEDENDILSLIDGYDVLHASALAQLDILLVPLETWHGLPTLSFVPPNLAAALWVQFALAVTNSSEIKKCEECPTWFEVAPGEGRPEKKYCSDACSMRAYRKRKKDMKDNS
jgi:hypothetical protein